MAAIDKICEYSREYPSYDMYGYKRNHIQIMPRHRKVFAKQPHTLYIFKPTLVKLSSWGGITFDDWEYDWSLYYDGPFDLAKYKLLIREFGYRITTQYHYCLHVPSVPGHVKGRYTNQTTELTTTKRRLRRMLRQPLNIKKINSSLYEWLKEQPR